MKIKKTKIGAGALGTVYLISDEKEPKQEPKQVVLKKIKMPSADIHHTVIREIHYLRFLSDLLIGEPSKNQKNHKNHKNQKHQKRQKIAQLLNIDVFPQKVSFMMEYGGKDLSTYIKQNIWNTRKHHLYEITKQCVDAMTFMHKYNIIHRDIKPSNILITFNDGNPEIRLCDLGLSKFLHSGEELHTKLVCTATYRPPELFFDGDFWDWWEENGGNQKEAYSHKIDYWSLGITITEYILGKSVIKNDTDMGILKEITKYFFNPKDFVYRPNEPTLLETMKELRLNNLLPAIVNEKPLSRINNILNSSDSYYVKLYPSIHTSQSSQSSQNLQDPKNIVIENFLKSALKWDYRSRELNFPGVTFSAKVIWIPKPPINIHHDIRHIFVENYFNIMNTYPVSFRAVLIAVDILDRFLSTVINTARNEYDNLVLYSMVCLFIASKFHDYEHISLESFTTQFSQSQILDAECKILNAIQFRFNHTTFLDFIPSINEENAKKLILNYKRIEGKNESELKSLVQII